MKFRWGILGCGNIARKFAQAVCSQPEMELVSVAARNRERAESFARDFGAQHAFAGYRALLESGTADAVYVATVNSDHADSLRLAIECGVPVLCEKPMLMHLSEFDEISALARRKHVPVMEAMWSVFLPTYAAVREILTSGVIGKPAFANLSFCVDFEKNPQSRLYNPALGGGLIYDVGVYDIHAALHLFGEGFSECRASGRIGETGVDTSSVIVLRYPDGVFVNLVTADVAGPNELEIYGEHGEIVVPQFWGSQEVRVRVGQEETVRKLPFDCNGFEYEIREFAGVVRSGRTESERLPLSRTRAVLSVMDQAIAQLRAQK